MLSHWPIRTKLKLGLGLLLVTVLALFGSAYYGLYAYRGLVKGLSARSAELPLAGKIRQHVSDIRVILSQAKERLEFPAAVEALSGIDSELAVDSTISWDAQLDRERYREALYNLVDAVDQYSKQLDRISEEANFRLSDDSNERQTLAEIFEVLGRISTQKYHGQLEEDWLLDQTRIGILSNEVEQLSQLAADLPSHLHARLKDLSEDVRAQYRTAIISAWGNALLALALLISAVRLFYKWFAKPLETLVEGSREVARGNFDHRIELGTEDEMGELAISMNDMTTRFQEIRDDLDRQVRLRTNQVVRSEQLASVGFLAAGVSHEINNPLASIALCSESLESRLTELLEQVDSTHAEDVKVAHEYLQMIQREAFRCKQITEKLLDFARMGDSQRHRTDLRELVDGVIDMVQHLGKYQGKNMKLLPGKPVIVEVNAQEIKQVMLNLITNGLESVDSGGTVSVSIERDEKHAQLIVEDNGCGMTDEVLKHLFEPFFTRRRSGQGTGLGLSITYRIVEEHHGTIEAVSEGAGKGSRFIVTLPANQSAKESHHQYQAA